MSYSGFAFTIGGKTGIRTLGTRKGTTVFETVPIDHSGIFPEEFLIATAKLQSFSIFYKYFTGFSLLYVFIEDFFSVFHL